MPANKQNILILFPDQLRADALGCNGCRAISTPHLDRLAREGTNFTRAVSPTPLCVPARASILTGRGALETGVLNNQSWLRPDRRRGGMPSWPEILNNQGYRTAAIGKMHFYPWDLSEGFRTRIIAEDKRHIHIRDDYQLYLHNQGLHKYHGKEHDSYLENKGAVLSRIPAPHQVDTWVASRTIAYLSGLDRSSPFAVMAGFPGPHCPYDPPQEYLDQVDTAKIRPPIRKEPSWMTEASWASCRRPWNGVEYSDATGEDYIRIRRHYLALVKQIDDGVGRILDYLDRSGLAEETTVLFTSDHGDFLGDHGMMGKQFYLDQAVSVPMIARGRGFGTARTNPSLVSVTDLFATILDIAGVPGPETMDSRVLKETGEDDRMVFGALDTGFFAAWKNWRLSRYGNGEVSLFHLEGDPREEENLRDVPQHRAVLERMNRALDEWILSSVLKGHADKRVLPGTGDPESSYNRRGWERPYPFSGGEKRN